MEFSHLETRSRDGWREWALINADVSERGVIVATETALVPDTLAADVDAVDIALDECGDLHVLDARGRILIVDQATGTTRRLACFGDEEGPADPTALCVTSETIYTADGTTGRVRAFSRELLQLRWISEPRFDDPVGIVHDGEGPSVLDRGTGHGDGRLVRLGEDGTITATESGLESPSDVTVDRAGHRYVLDREDEEGDVTGSAVIRTFLAGDGDTVNGVPSTDIRLEDPLREASRIAAVAVGEILIAVAREGDAETTLYSHQLCEESLEQIDRLERGCSGLVAPSTRERDGIGEAYAIDETGGIYGLDAVEETARNERTARYDAQLIQRLDSGERGTDWHRATLDIDQQGRNRQVRLSYYAEDDGRTTDPDDLLEIDGIGEGYASRLREVGIPRSNELALCEPDALSERIGVSPTKTGPWIEDATDHLVDWGRWKPTGEPNPSDALLDPASGRYLWVKIELIGNEDSSPRVGSFRAYFPRQSYLRYLPAVYRQDGAGTAFLEQFLSIFESFFTDIEEELDDVTRYMDPGGIPAGELPWLGSWIGLDIDEEWPESARRELASRAPELYKKRGTRGGLLSVLRIYLRHTRPRSAWREALETGLTEIKDVLTERALTRSEAIPELGKYEPLRASSGETGLREMVVWWSRVLAAWESVLEWRDETLTRLEDADAMTTEERERADDRLEETAMDVVRRSDEGSLPYVVEYARVLEGYADELENLADRLRRADTSTSEVEVIEEEYETLMGELTAEQETYEGAIQETANQGEPFLIEAPDLDCITDDDVRRPFAELVGHERGFVVLTRPSVGADRQRTVRRIVDAEQPAHAAGRAVNLQPWIQLSGHSYLGINSTLSKRELVLDRSDLGEDSVLETREPFAQLDVRSKLDGDSFIS